MKRIHLIFVLISVIFTACNTYNENQLKSFDLEIEDWMKKKNTNLERTGSGLYYSAIVAGSGQNIKYTDSVAVVFKGKLLNGTVFEIEKEPVTFAVRDVVVGWKEALLMSQNKSVIQIIVPPQLGYGDHKLDKIPKNAILLYEIEIVDIK